MSQRVKRSGAIIRGNGPVWNIKVGVGTPVSKKVRTINGQTKIWKIKVILN
ncbi:MAG: hypothetical protein HN778_21490 [Prolixibacteraceae bacterium]|nr:hypothetical protein [Prolixibacteraceae bacterium]MBT6764164.1 hypothetical protein [Prolixibacteraceae bacterium]MBT6998609.1 hypothetical protein [Prolixibacteraceae bacterium]MBT7397410.1 hypothetical protein [Prolixibacteraceae bacterium]